MEHVKLIELELNGEVYDVDLYKVDNGYDIFFECYYIETINVIDEDLIKSIFQKYIQNQNQ